MIKPTPPPAGINGERATAVSKSKEKEWLRRCRVLFDRARRTGKPLSIIALCVENYADLRRELGTEGVDNAMNAIKTGMAAALAPSNAIGRLASAFFVVVLPGSGVTRAVDLAGRLERHIDSAALALGSRRVIAHARSAIASLDADHVSSSEELMKLAVHRAMGRVQSRVPSPSSGVNDASTLTPGERAILRQISQLESQSASGEYEFNAVSTGWPLSHRAAYMAAYEGLISKGFIGLTATPQTFTVTTKGLQAVRVL